MLSVASRLVFLVALFAIGAAEAQEAKRSLLFNPSDAAAMARARADFERMNATGQPVEEAAPATPNIYVSAVADYGSGHWTVWANGLRISPNRQSPLFTVLAVQDDVAVIRVSDEHKERILLQPYQTWLSRSRKIVQGIFP